MTTFEEDVVECYYNLKGYLTVKNVCFSAVEKRPGGKGRGEIDLLAVLIGKEGKIKDAVHIEVAVSLTSQFPFISRRNRNYDEVWRLLKKFFMSDADEKIKEYFKSSKWRSQLISSDFDSEKAFSKLSRRLKELGAEHEILTSEADKIEVRVRFNDKEKQIEIRPFSKILSELKEIFQEQNLSEKSFQDPRLRGIQYLAKYLK